MKGAIFEHRPTIIVQVVWGGVGCHFHPSIMNDKGVPNPKNQTNDFGEDMDMNYTKLMKKKKWKTIEGPFWKTK
jgi:hypothetical protein